MGDTGKKDKDKRRKQQIKAKEQKIKEKQDKQSRATPFSLQRGKK